MTHFSQIKWRLLVLTLLAYFTTVGNAYADNYNFYFTKPPKKKSKSVEPQTSNDENSSEDDQEPRNTPEPVQKSEPAPATASPSANTQTLTVPNTQQPIIINNTNNVGYPPATSPQYAVPASSGDSGFSGETKVSTVLLPGFQEQPRSNWRMGFSGILLLSDVQRAYSSMGTLRTYDSKSESWGGLITLGWDITRVLGFNFYGGASHNGDLERFNTHYGADLQLMPLRIPLRSFDLVEFGFLVGGSNILAARDNIGTLHAGAKLNINFGRDYGFTASTRANLGHFLLEAGFVARI